MKGNKRLNHCKWIFAIFAAQLSGCGSKDIFDQNLPAKIAGCATHYLSSPGSASDRKRIGLTCDDTELLSDPRDYSSIESISITPKGQADSIDLLAFPNLKSLQVDNANIKALNLANNNLLSSIILSTSGLQELTLPTASLNYLELKNQGSLERLDAANTQIKSISIIGNTTFDLDLFLSTHTEISTLNLQVPGFDLQDFSLLTNLNELSISDQNQEAIDLKPLQKLVFFEIKNSKITSLDASGLPNLRDLWLYDATIEELDLSENPTLTHFKFTNTKIETLDIKSSINLKDMVFSGTNIETTDNFDASRLDSLSLDDSKFGGLDYSETTNLSSLVIRGGSNPELDLSKTKVTSLNLDRADTHLIQMPNLIARGAIHITDHLSDILQVKGGKVVNLTLDSKTISSLDISQLTELEQLYLTDLTLDSFDVSALFRLKTFILDSITLDHLDLTTLTRLEMLNFYDAHISSVVIPPQFKQAPLPLENRDLICTDLRGLWDGWSELQRNGRDREDFIFCKDKLN